MRLKDLLSEKRSAIFKKWFDITLKSYPSDSAHFLKNQAKQFTNPVGYTISQGLESFIDSLLQDTDAGKTALSLENIIRIKAVQDVAPSQALSFLFHLKKVIREELGDTEEELGEEVLALEARIDAISLLAVDLYVQCREKIYDLKANEIKNMTFRLLQRAKLVCEVPGQ